MKIIEFGQKDKTIAFFKQLSGCGEIVRRTADSLGWRRKASGVEIKLFLFINHGGVREIVRRTADSLGGRRKACEVFEKKLFFINYSSRVW